MKQGFFPDILRGESKYFGGGPNFSLFFYLWEIYSVKYRKIDVCMNFFIIFFYEYVLSYSK